MQRLDPARAKAICESVRAFLTYRSTGCHFASSLASSGAGIYWVALAGRPDENLAEQLNVLLHEAEDVQELAVPVFPDLRTSDDIADLLEILCSTERWQLQERQWKDHARSDALFHVKWTNSSGLQTSVLGMAPLGCMPAVRRAPFVSMALWPGPKRNNMRKEKSKLISIGDMPPPIGISAEGYDHLVQETKARVADLTSIPPEGAARRDVTFCLDEQCGRRLRAFISRLP